MGTQALVTHQGGAVELRRDTSELAELQRLGSLLSASGYFSDARDMAQAAVKVMAGKELGLPPIASMMGINIIKGKIALGGNLLATCVRNHGYDYRVKRLDASGCLLEFFSKKDASGKREHLGESSFDESDAKAAKLTGSDNYGKFPRNMYFNRAISNGVKWFCPEVTGGSPVYTPEELGARVDSDGNYAHEDQTVAPRESRDELIQRRISEEREKLAAIQSQKAAAPEPTAPPAEAESVAIIDRAGLEATLKTFSGFQPIVQAFTEMKEEIGKYADTTIYYGILRNHNMEHANKFGTLKNAKACYTALWEALQELKQEPQEPEGITDQDLPEILRGQSNG
jgi:hypothetical protein